MAEYGKDQRMRSGTNMRTEAIIGGRKCFIYKQPVGTGHPKNLLIQPIDAHDLEVLDREVELIGEYAPDADFALVAFLIKEWNEELSPWQAPAVFGDQGFGEGGERTLAYVLEELLPGIAGYLESEPWDDLANDRQEPEKDMPWLYLGGYSLAGLFSLWAAYQTELFEGVAGVSPSVWFPGWEQYITTHAIRTGKVYLSLGDREERTRNPIMSCVGANIRSQQKLLQADQNVKRCVLEWNPGNHFKDSEIRCAKGFAWLLQDHE